jgi:multidrug resistance protein, MATE family
MTPSPLRLSFGQEMSATLRLAAPLAAAALAQMGMGLTDTILLGSLGRDALAAGGLGAGLFFTTTAIMQGAMAGVGVLVSHARGSGHVARISPIFRAGMVLALLAALPVMAALWFLEPILLAAGEPALLARDVGQYERILLWAVPAAMWMATQRTYLAAINHPHVVMAVTIVAVVLNGFLNYGLLHGAWGLPNMGYLGSATASAIALWIMAGATALIIKMQGQSTWGGGIDWSVVRELFHIGWPIAATVAVELLLFAASGLMMGVLGNTALAAHQVAIGICSTTFMVPFAISQAVNVRIGFHLGADAPEAARRAGHVAFILGIGFMAIAAIVFLTTARPLALLFNLDPGVPTDADVIALVISLLAVGAAFQIFDGAQVIAAGTLRGYKDTRIPMVLAALSYWGVGFPVAWVLGFTFGGGPVGIWWGLAIGLMVAMALLCTRFHHLSYAAEGSRNQSISGS